MNRFDCPLCERPAEINLVNLAECPDCEVAWEVDVVPGVGPIADTCLPDEGGEAG